MSDGRLDNSQWHMLPKAAQDAWRQYARRAGMHNRTSDAFAAGVWWAITYALGKAAVLVQDAPAIEGDLAPQAITPESAVGAAEAPKEPGERRVA